MGLGGMAAAVLFGLAVAGAAQVGAVQAAEPSVGRWAVDPARCNVWGGSDATSAPLTVYESGLSWFSGYCRFAKVYKAGPALYIQAQCWSGGDVPVTLDARGDRMRVSWNRGKPEEMRRCK